MTFSEALEAMISERVACRRNSWRSDKTFYQVVYQVRPRGKLPYLEIWTAEGKAPYVPSQRDMHADDWGAI